MRYLVLGCNGMAGHMISIYLKEQGNSVKGFARKRLGIIDTIEGDVHNTEELEETISNEKPDCIVNCIGILNRAAENNKSEAVYINSYLPHLLADITKDMKTQVVHLSTDCVFSGKKGKYKENDIKDGLTFYDRTKALGEIEDNKNITLRTSIIGPDINKDGIGLFNWFMNATKLNDTINGYDQVIWTGQTTLQLAKTIEVFTTTKQAGLVNIVPDTSISKYEMLCLFNKYFKDNAVCIKRVSDIKSDKSLVRTNFSSSYTIPDYEYMIKELALWMDNHKYLYQHYY